MAAMVDDLENLRLEDSTWRVWTLAIRPKTLSAAVAPVLIAAGLAAMNDAFVLLPVVAAFAGAIFIQIGTNLANDYYDHFLGADTHERVGPLRVTQFGLIPPNRVWWGMMVALAIASMIGVYLIKVGGWPILWIGLSINYGNYHFSLFVCFFKIIAYFFIGLHQTKNCSPIIFAPVKVKCIQRLYQPT